MAAARAAREMGVEWWDPPPCIYCILSQSLINGLSPVDVGGFAEPRKILCLNVLTPPLSNYQYITGHRIPPNMTRSMEVPWQWTYKEFLRSYKNAACFSCVLVLKIKYGSPRVQSWLECFVVYTKLQNLQHQSKIKHRFRIRTLKKYPALQQQTK